MDEPILQIEKITGIAEKNAACGVFVGRITLGDGTLGTLVACILTEGANDDVSELLRDIFELSVKKLENSQTGSLKTIKTAGDACRQYAQGKQENLKVNFLLAFFYESATYIARQGDKIKIFVFEKPRSIEIKFDEGSGPLKRGQIYLIATEKFLPIFDRSIFSKEQEVFDPQEIIDGLATEISARDDQSEIGAAMIMVKGEQSDKETKTERVKESEDEGTEESEVSGVSRASTVEESAVPSAGFKFKNPLPSILRAVLSEVKKLARGDLGAILRLRKKMAVVVVVILLILAASAAFTIRQKNQQEKLAQFDQYITQASAKYDEAVAILELNRTRAREILIDAEKDIKAARQIDPKNEKVNKLSEDISQKLKETEVQSTINFQVLSEHSQGVNSLSTMGQKIVAAGSDKIFEIDPDSKTGDETEGPADINSGFVFDNTGFLLAGDQIWRVNLPDGKSEKIIEGQTGHDIAVFIGNVYLLGEDQVVKFSPIENGYADGIDYLNERTNLGSSSRFAIDGNVWITNGPKILKFLRGEKQDFELQGLTAQIGQLEAIYTSPSIDNLYVIDRANSALLVVDKDGIYQKAYQSPEFGRASDLVVNDDESKVYLAIGDKILEAEL